jgi:phosphonate transport system permease protein
MPDARDRPRVWPWALLLALLAFSLWGCDLDLSPLLSAEERAQGLSRLATLLGSFWPPKLTGDYLLVCAGLTLDTAATATLGVALAIVLGLALALLSSRNVVVGEARGFSRLALTAVCEAARVVQDVLRGVPDFAWAVVFVGIVGLGPPAGVIALGLNVAGIIARVFSELFDAVPRKTLEPLRQAGASRLQAWFYGVVPAIAQNVLSFALLRWECAMRNATVIGVVGGGRARQRGQGDARLRLLRPRPDAASCASCC